MATYSEKLKDPRWQKKRLEIFQRDDFKCVYCGDDKNTLHIHHLQYDRSHKDPWDYENEKMITLCEYCHQLEFNNRNHNESFLLERLREFGYSFYDIKIIEEFLTCKFLKTKDRDLMMETILYFNRNEGKFEDVIEQHGIKHDNYRNYILNKFFKEDE
jgi:glutaredoxin